MIESKSSRKLVSLTANSILGIFAFLCIIPIIAVISISMSNQGDIVEFGYKLIPKSIDFKAYEYLFKAPKQILNAYGISIFVTLFGTVFSLAVVSLIAYPLSRKDFGYKKTYLIYCVFLHFSLMVGWCLSILLYQRYWV